jgi:hypothetical protein
MHNFLKGIILERSKHDTSSFAQFSVDQSRTFACGIQTLRYRRRRALGYGNFDRPRQVNYYRRRIKRMENKYGMDFDKFTARLKGKATPAQEDDWLAWKSARSMLADWQKTYQDLRHEISETA